MLMSALSSWPQQMRSQIMAKQQLRKKLRESMAAMSDQQRKEESEKLVKKVVLELSDL